MANTKLKLQIEQLNKKFNILKSCKDIALPSKGWIFTTRKTLNMSLNQLGNKLNITAQSVKEIEEREKKIGNYTAVSVLKRRQGMVVNKETELKEALKKDFRKLYVKEFSAFWERERLVREIEIDLMRLRNTLELLGVK